MKKILLIMFCMIFLVGTVNGFEIDNWKYYDEEKREYLVVNAFGQGEEIARIKLTSDLNQLVPRGYQKVAEFNIENYDDYVNVFNDMEFYDLKKDNEFFTRPFNYKYKTIAQVPYYKTVCDKGLNENGTARNINCRQEQAGFTDQVFWEEINKVEGLLKGNITIGIFTEVQKGDKVEWIPTLFGERLMEWAGWEESWNTDLIAYYKLDGSSGIVLDSVGNYNGTNIGATRDVAGKINDSFDFNHSEGDMVNISDMGEFVANNKLSVSAWVKPRSYDCTTCTVISQYQDVGTRSFLFDGATTSARFIIHIADGTPAVSDAGYGLPIGIFTHMVGVWNGTSATIYINGSQVDSASLSGTIRNSPNNITMSARGSSGSYWDGLIDEVAIWSRVLSDSEISDLYDAQKDGFVNGSYTDVFVPTVTLNSPINAFNTTNQTINFNGTVVYINGIINVTLFIDGILNETNSSGINDTDYIFTKNIIDGDHNWTYESCNSGGCTTATTRIFTIDTTPIINVFSPTNTTFTISTIFFNATSNLTIDKWIVNYNGTNVTLSDINTTLEVEDGSHQLLLYANNSVSGAFGLNDTINFSVDTNPPELNITFPLNTSYIDNFTKTTIKSMVLNYTVTDTSLDSCIIVNISTGVNISSASCTNITFTQIYNQYTFRVYANDTFGRNSTDSEVATFDYKILRNNFSFTNTTLEGALETFTYDFNVSAGVTATSVALIYNGTSYSTTLTTSGDNVLSSRDLTIPQVNTQTNFTFNWNITLSDGFTYNSSSYNQTVNSLALDNCSVFTNLIYNYTIVDEELQTTLSNTTVELNIDFFDITRTVDMLNFSQSYSDNPVLICIDASILATTIYSVDTIVKYESINYEIEYYNIVNFTLSNSTIPQNITLYDLNSSDATEFTISFKGEDFVFVENALIFIDRQYIIENNSFKTVELPKTDANGQTVGHFVRNDVVYNIRVVKDGVVLGNFNNIIAFCQDFTIGDCQIVLEATPEEQDTFNYDEELGITFQSIPTYNNNTNAISFSFSVVDGTVKTIFMEVTRNDIFGNRTLCNNSVTSASGTLSCTINPGIDDTVLQTRVFVNNQLAVLSNVKLESSDYGNIGYVLWFILTFVFILIFGSSKTELLIGILISFTGAIALGVTRGDIIGLGSAGIWILVIVILGIWKINKDNPQ